MMKAITHDDCLVNHRDQCSTCGLLLQPLWTFFYPGNFFSARCDYVKKLQPPLFWIEASNNMTWDRPSKFGGVMFNETISTLGATRVAMEHWIGSHPSIKPCDLSPYALISKWNYGEGKWFRWYFEFRAAPPRHPILSDWVRIRPKEAKRVLQDKASRVREFNLLGGRLYRWSKFYPGALPGRDSWIWSYFPDGEYWWNLTLVYNGNVSAVLERAWVENPVSDEWIELLQSSPKNPTTAEFFNQRPKSPTRAK